MESSISTPLEGRAVDARTMAEAFRRTVAAHPSSPAVRSMDGAIDWTYAELAERVDALAGGLSALGLEKGQTMGILLVNRPEFSVADLAAMTLGATPFSIYATSSAEQVEYVMTDSQAQIVITERAFLDTVLTARANLPGLGHVIVIDAGDEPLPDGVTDIADIEGSNPSFDPEAHWRAVSPEDVLTLIYTSGTTGPPKGVELVHRNLIAAVQAVEALVQFPHDGRVISWLPAAHIAERAAHHYLPITFGLSVTTCSDPRQIVAVLPQVRPNWFFAVPRIWEKLKAGLEIMFGQLPDDERERTAQALDAALQKVRLEQAGEPVPGELSLAVARADEALFSRIREQFGLDQLSAVNVGAAPTPVAVLEFFHAIGVPVAELWGMSETCGAGCCNPRGRVKIGTVGPPAPGVEIKLGEDGEVLIRSDVVMAGYRNQPEKTAEAVDPDGWLHTGDIGTIDEDGYLTIVDRKKEIIINAAGKNMSPANIEATLKASSPLIGQAAVIGDARPYNVALVVLDADFAPMWAAQRSIEGDLAALAGDAQVRAAVQEGVDAANARLARVEQVKAFHVVAGDWLPGGDELTPTMKLRRRPIGEKYATEIDGLYAG